MEESLPPIELSNLIGNCEKLKRTITFDGISKYSFLRKQFKDPYADLINVVVGNHSYVFHPKQSKDFLHQLDHIETFNKIDEQCNTGLPSFVRTENDLF